MEDKGGNWTKCATRSETSSDQSERMLLRTRKSAAVSVNWRGSPPSKRRGWVYVSEQIQKKSKIYLSKKEKIKKKQKQIGPLFFALATCFFWPKAFLSLFSPPIIIIAELSQQAAQNHHEEQRREHEIL